MFYSVDGPLPGTKSIYNENGYCGYIMEDAFGNPTIFNKDNQIVDFQIEDVFISQDGSAGGIALEDGNIGYLDDNFGF